MITYKKKKLSNMKRKLQQNLSPLQNQRKKEKHLKSNNSLNRNRSLSHQSKSRMKRHLQYPHSLRKGNGQLKMQLQMLKVVNRAINRRKNKNKRKRGNSVHMNQKQHLNHHINHLNHLICQMYKQSRFLKNHRNRYPNNLALTSLPPHYNLQLKIRAPQVKNQEDLKDLHLIHLSRKLIAINQTLPSPSNHRLHYIQVQILNKINGINNLAIKIHFH